MKKLHCQECHCHRKFMALELRGLQFLFYRTALFHGRDSSCFHPLVLPDLLRSVESKKAEEWCFSSTTWMIVPGWHEFFVEDHFRVFSWKAEMMKLGNIWKLLKILSKEWDPVIYGNNNTPIVRSHELCFVYSGWAGSLYQACKFVQQRYTADFVRLL